MTDPIGTLLRTEADRLSAGVVPPPLGVLDAHRPVRWRAGLAAAAAVLLVAGGAAVVARRAGAPAPIAAGPVVPYERLSNGFRLGDAPPPLTAGTDPHLPPYDTDGRPRCAAPGFGAALELPSAGASGRLVLASHLDNGGCRLADGDPVITFHDATGREVARSAYAVQPQVVNPPVRDRRFVSSGDGVLATFAWASHCGGAPVSARLSGVTAEPVDVSLTGSAPPCAGGAERPVLGLLGGYGIVPRERAALVVSLELPAEVAHGTPLRAVARLENPTDAPLSLTPCPRWAAETSAGSLPEGRVPCDALPPAVAPRTAVRFEVEVDLSGAGGSVAPPPALTRHTVRFGIAGTEPWSGEVLVRNDRADAPLAVVPWRDTPAPPGDARPDDPRFGEVNPYSSLRAVIAEVPASVAPGSTLTFSVLVSNTAHDTAVAWDPCPGFVQRLRLDTRDVAFAEHYLNCAAAPAEIRPRDTVLFRMELRVPADAPPGRAELLWKIGKLDFSGTESATATVRIEG